ncbi:ATP/GTP-binding protein [Streptomyces tanashiensis]|uniref:ATP/GTP-binding protein n=1 Tax=Streptomyces tanashiensis TaxID=67367 RepID=A0ABY6QWL6_9ACTN|nr:ATP/GTP-binding protein [Streptomyces tanashiensis]UZX21393.1 ATP/GTP-binding protein [Streptomyces tanashiensis]
METDGTYESRDTRGGAVPRPAGPPTDGRAAHPDAPAHVPAPPRTPPRPTTAPGTPVPGPAAPAAAGAVPGAPVAAGAVAPPVVAWLDAPRPEAAPGIWRFRHVPPPPPREARKLAPVTVAGLLIPLVIGLLLWSAWRRGAVPYQWIPLATFTPADWWYGGGTSPRDWHGAEAHVVYDGVFFAVLVYAIARLGAWAELSRHLLADRRPPVRAALTAGAALIVLTFVWPEAFPGVGWDALPVVAPLLSLVVLLGGGYDVLTSPALVYTLYALITAAVLWPFARLGDWPGLVRGRLGARAAATPPPLDPAAPVPLSQWPELRAAGGRPAADLLAAELYAGRMNDVDCARVRRSVERGRTHGGGLASFVDTVLRQGAAAGAHPSGDRDLPGRAATHDLLLGQVRIGRCVAEERNPAAYRGVGLALEPAALATSLLVVGPSGAGKTTRLTGPVVESLTLQALTGACAVVAVGTADAPLGPDAAYDVVVRPGDPASPYDLDLYAGLGDPDEAAALLAEGLVGDVENLDARRAATVLAQLIGPYRAAHGRFPSVPVLRELLEAGPETLTALLDRLPADGTAMRRELEARIRQAGTSADAGPLLADRLSLLDRPAFAEFFGADGSDVRPFSLKSVVHHPLRVRIKLPERGHEEASRLLARLVLAQFLAAARTGAKRAHFVSLVLDDATGALTAGTVRSLQRLRPHDAGVVLGLRTLGEVPEALHGPLFGAVGCRVALSGITTWDGRGFAETWGKEWVETTEVAHHTVFADQPMTRFIHAVRKRVTGKAVTTDAVTTRKVERERWSASELAHSLPPGHAVVSLTTAQGAHTPPVLVDLRG